MPSRNEPFEIVVFEAWDAKKPVVASNAVVHVEKFQKSYDLLKKRYN